MCNIFLSCGLLTGKRMVKITERRTKQDWAYYLEDVAIQCKNVDKITL
jgi:hypothetical protein